jgi:fused signal recognition particle receptor
MFKFFKKKIGGFFKKSSKEVEKKAEKEAEKEIKEEIKKEEKKAEKKQEKKKETKEEIREEKKEKKGLFKQFKEKFSYKLDEDKFDDIFSELEEILIESNVAMESIDFIKDELKKELVGKEIKKGEIEKKLKEAMSKAINNLLIEPFDLIKKIKEKKEKPYIICFFGINGSGKTTSIAKLCKYLQNKGLNCVLAASDTFRAASIEQLEKHASKLGVKVIKHQYGADPAAVAFDAIKHAKAQGIDIVLIDTAGRMHTQGNLMQEMQKIIRVSKPDMRIFVGEAIVGNDAVEQAKTFNEKIGLDAIILSKADIDEKAGATISVSYVTKKPILFLGIGQEYKDLELFDKRKIIKQLGF